MFKSEIAFCHTKTCNRNLKVKTISFKLSFQLSFSFPQQFLFWINYSWHWQWPWTWGWLLLMLFRDIAHLYSNTFHHWQGFQYLLTTGNKSIWFCLFNQFLFEDSIDISLDNCWVACLVTTFSWCLSFSRTILFLVVEYLRKLNTKN